MKHFLIPVLLLPAPAFAADGLDLSAAIRLRYETIEGQPRTGFNASDDLLNLRTILNATWRERGFRVVAELHDSRVYLDDAGTPVTTNEVDTLELMQAHLSYTWEAPFGPKTKLDVQAGRFTLNLGSRRLVAADDYRNTTNGYTGLRADFAAPGEVTATAIYTLPHIRLPEDRASLGRNDLAFDRESFDLVLWGGLIAKRTKLAGMTAELSYYHLGERDAPGRATRDRSLDSIGLRLFRNPARGRFDFENEAIYQSGSISAGTRAADPRLDVSAGFIHLEAGYTLSARWTPRLAFEFDYASGDGRGARFTRFDTLFGSRRNDLAPAGLYNAIGRTNLVAPALRIEAVPSERLDAFVAYRALYAASRTDAFSTTGVRDASGRSGRFGGHQIEGRVRYWLIPKKLQFEANALVLAKGRLLRDAPNAPRNGDARYLSLNLTASL